MSFFFGRLKLKQMGFVLFDVFLKQATILVCESSFGRFMPGNGLFVVDS